MAGISRFVCGIAVLFSCVRCDRPEEKNNTDAGVAPMSVDQARRQGLRDWWKIDWWKEDSRDSEESRVYLWGVCHPHVKTHRDYKKKSNAKYIATALDLRDLVLNKKAADEYVVMTEFDSDTIAIYESWANVKVQTNHSKNLYNPYMMRYVDAKKQFCEHDAKDPLQRTTPSDRMILFGNDPDFQKNELTNVAKFGSYSHFRYKELRDDHVKNIIFFFKKFGQKWFLRFHEILAWDAKLKSYHQEKNPYKRVYHLAIAYDPGEDKHDVGKWVRSVIKKRPFWLMNTIESVKSE